MKRMDKTADGRAVSTRPPVVTFVFGAVAFVCLALTARGEDKVAWMLQTNLLEKSETSAAANLPNVLVLGDSISMGYTPFVKKRLAGIANVSRPARNCQATQAYLAPRGGMRDWVGTNRWAVITVNAGIWDICYMKGDPLKTDHYWGADAELARLTPLARGTAIRDRGFRVRTPILEYQANLRKILTFLKSTGATVLFALTTPVPAYEGDDRCGLFRAYNEIAVGVCAELGVRTVDLYAVAERHYDLMKDRCHFNDEGNDLLAGVLCNEIRAALPSAGSPDFAEVGPEAYRPLRRELRAYYPEECHERMRDPSVSNSFARIWSDVETWFAAHPEAAERCPWEPPRTFFEGLNTLWPCREVFGYVDGLSCFSLGHPDMRLIDLCRRDLAAGPKS